jgi:Rrf2 family iron-sulfur cluster assembly transcriptional regulator
MARGERCLTHDLWDALSQQIENYLSHITLADVLDGRLTPAAGYDRTAAA